MKFPILYLLLLVCSSTLIAQHNDRTYLGVLENTFVSPNDTSRIKIQRVLFRYENNKWYSLVNASGDSIRYPLKSNWVIGFNGKSIGHFESKMTPLKHPNDPWSFPRDAHHTPTKSDLPSIGKPTMEFAGWAGIAHPRPLVTNSKSYFSDLEKWKPFQPKESEKSDYTSIYLEHFETIIADWVGTVDISKLKFDKSYLSHNSDQLIQLGAIRKANNKEYISNRIWIYKSASGEIVDLSKAIDLPFIGTGDSEVSNLYLVDVGDYDNDGSSDALFWIDRYNGNGYVLFYDKFGSHVSFEWSYH